MTNIELYINGKLCDTTKDFIPRLNKQLLNPAELNTKDAQMSFTISIPATENNNAVFNYSHVEETKNKLNREYSAELIINSVRILVGRFRVSEITAKGYKGNLYVPQGKEIKDIFGDLRLTDNPPYTIGFTNFVTSINTYNNNAATTPQPAIFPYVLYGLLPKVPTTKDGNTYTARDVWDASVRIGIEDFPPSINVLLLLKHIFQSNGYKIIGSAFDDRALTEIYMSYKNPTTYRQPWNYGYHAKIQLTGHWSSRYNARNSYAPYLEKGVFVGSDDTGTVYACNLLSATNSQISVTQDTGANVNYREIEDSAGRVWVDGQIRIPASGFYKVRFNASIQVYSTINWRQTDGVTDVQHIGGSTANASNTMLNNLYEIRLCRDRKTADFNLSEPKFNGTFYRNNQPQDNIVTDLLGNIFGNDDDDPKEGQPRYFPSVTSDGQINLVDKYQDKKHLLGFAFGANTDYASALSSNYINPIDAYSKYFGQVLAAKPGVSWERSENDGDINRIAIQNPGYIKYGRLEQLDNPGQYPPVNLNWSGGPFINDFALDALGNPTVPALGNIVLHRFPIDRYFTYALVGGTTAFTGTAYVHNGSDTVPLAAFPIINGIGGVETTFGTRPETLSNLKLTIIIKSGSFDVTGSLVINRSITVASQDAIGYTPTDKYAITLDNAPANFARRGQYNGGFGWDSDWYAQGEANAVVWLEAGELLTIASVTSEGRYRENGMHSTFGWVGHELHYSLSVQPFRTDAGWLKVNDAGRGTAAMDWNDTPNFISDYIDLIDFLSSDVRIDDFIDNFCKAFNLKLSPVDSNTFSLDIKQTETTIGGNFIDLDTQASVVDRVNTPLNLPGTYRIGFTVDKDEQGYNMTSDDGGGEFSTDAIEASIIEQKSFFSYNWFMAIAKFSGPPPGVQLYIPVISKKDVWDTSVPYEEAMLKRYTDQPYRFWYYHGLLTVNGATFPFLGGNLQPARLSDTLSFVSVLNYKNQQFSILQNYFTLLVDNSSHYTELQAYLTAEQYHAFNGSMLARFNGDIYYVAEISGYDPTGRNKTTIKLIRKIK